jgi:hypothetical protein
MFERRDIPFLDFPAGEGPPLYMTISRGEWHRLGPGQAHAVSLEEPEGEGGAFAFGLSTTVAVVWIHTPPDGPGVAYCYHAPPGPLDARAHEVALAAVGCARIESEHLYVVVAAMHRLTTEDEGFFLAQGVRTDRLFTYSNSFLPQFGVSAQGYVGEAA